jgi:UDP-4-amino-4,6-dideoxy-N-acetyl-beta-L-altrosamine transaminase
MIPYARQSITDEDVEAVVTVLRSDFQTQGPQVERFERALMDHTGAAHAVAVSSATAALHLAALACDLGPGDVLWTVPNTFTASANCARYCGADVDFVDINALSFNIDIPALERKLDSAARAGRLPKALVAVHFSGMPCDLRELRALSQRYEFRIIEDASHALGAEYDGTKIGAGTYSDVTVMSFHPVKIVTTGEGGMLLTNDAALFRRLAILRTHGITRDPMLMETASDGPWFYQQIELGFNYRLTDIQAALGTSQLTRLDAFIARRRSLAAKYREGLADLPIAVQSEGGDRRSAWHLFPIQLLDDTDGTLRARVYEALLAAGIRANVHYIPVHTQPYYQRLGFRFGDFPRSEEYYRRALSLPMYYELTDPEVEYVIATLREVLRKEK